MQDPIAEESYSAIKEKAKKQYAEIGHVWCPFLNENIYFTKAGFKHLIWKGARQRPKTEQKRRFLLLSFVKNIIESSDVVFKYERRGGADFWASTNIYGNKKITLILRQLDGQAKHFFSIFSDKKNRFEKRFFALPATSLVGFSASFTPIRDWLPAGMKFMIGLSKNMSNHV